MNTASPSPLAKKRVLVLDYSQSGQLSRIAERIVAPLRADDTIAVHVETLHPQPDYPFPWGFFSFLDVFPEAAHMVPPALGALNLSGDEHFDLIILPYQVWFLAPSPPVVAFLASAEAARILHGKPVVTVIACRNMWMMAHERMKERLARLGARLLDNVVFVDDGPTLATFITTPRWLLTGNQGPFLGLPAAGVASQQIAGARRFGLALRDALARDAERGDAPMLSGLAAVTADPRLYSSERTGRRSFHAWGALLRAVGPAGAARRRPFLLAYVIFLVCAIICIVPVSLAVQALLRPFLSRRLDALKERFEAPSGSGTERMSLYEH
ncbi:MAG: dialkylresorcinol condensing enzyme [Rhodocyclaceae bacterium]